MMREDVLKLVDGSTRILGIVGHPIAQVRAPQVSSAMFRLHRLDFICIPLHVLPEDLATFFRGACTLRNLSGLIVTIPHKPAAADYVDALTPRARLVRSVNYIAIAEDGRWTGDIIDGLGFVNNLRSHGVELKGKRALLVGAGGVGGAIAFAVAEAGVAELAVYDKDERRARDIADRVAATGTRARFGDPDPAGFEIVINATPIGMRPQDPLPIDAARIERGAVVADVIVEPTRLLEAARARGCRTFMGDGMMDHQLELMAVHLGLGNLDFSAGMAARVALHIIRP
jgi:shikimate dehydrogenase